MFAFVGPSPTNAYKYEYEYDMNRCKSIRLKEEKEIDWLMLTLRNWFIYIQIIVSLEE